MADWQTSYVITSPLPSQPALQRHRCRHRVLPSSLRRRRRWNNARSPSSPLGTTQAFVCASSSSSLCRRFPPPHRSRERRLHPSRDDLPPLLVLRDVGLTTTTHATRRALCVARTRGTRLQSRLGAAGSLPAGGGGGGGCLVAAGGGWGWLVARGAGGQRRRRRRPGEFGLNTGIFSPKLPIFFGACRR